MENPVRIDASQARHKAAAGDALLVCAYDDAARCRDLLVDGAISMDEFRKQREALAERLEVIFYGADGDDELPERRAREFGDQFTRTRALEGGVEAWKQAGLPMAAETSPENPPGRM